MAKDKFMGQDVSVDTKKGVMKVDNAGKTAIMSELGVTSEVQKMVKKANRILDLEALKFVGERCVKSNDKTRLELGAGSNMTSYTMTPAADRRDPSTGKQIKVYGSFTKHVAGATPGDKDFVAAHDKFREQLKKKNK